MVWYKIVWIPALNTIKKLSQQLIDSHVRHQLRLADFKDTLRNILEYQLTIS